MLNSYGLYFKINYHTTMRHLVFLFTSTLLLAACRQQPSGLQEELAQAKAHVKALESELAALARPEGELVHIVFLKLKEGLDEAQADTLITEIKKLMSIEGVHGLEVGRIADTGDERFISGHEIVFQMSFADMAAYEAYQNHPTHLQLKKVLGAYLGGPPAVYDYWRE